MKKPEFIRISDFLKRLKAGKNKRVKDCNILLETTAADGRRRISVTLTSSED